MDAMPILLQPKYSCSVMVVAATVHEPIFLKSDCTMRHKSLDCP